MGLECCALRACLSVVCLSVRCETTRPSFTKFSTPCYRPTNGRGSVFLWRRCDRLCTRISGFVDDVMLARVQWPRTGDAKSVHTHQVAAPWRILKVTHQRRSLMSIRLPCLCACRRLYAEVVGATLSEGFIVCIKAYCLTLLSLLRRV